jgi:hypothetical protein
VQFGAKLPQNTSSKQLKWPFGSKRGASHVQSVELASKDSNSTAFPPLSAISKIPQLLQELQVPGMLTDMLSGKSGRLQGDTLGALAGLFQDPGVAAAAARDGVIQVSS